MTDTAHWYCVRHPEALNAGPVLVDKGVTATRDVAKATCEADGMHLPTIREQADLDAIVALTGNSELACSRHHSTTVVQYTSLLEKNGERKKCQHYCESIKDAPQILYFYSNAFLQSPRRKKLAFFPFPLNLSRDLAWRLDGLPVWP